MFSFRIQEKQSFMPYLCMHTRGVIDTFYFLYFRSIKCAAEFTSYGFFTITHADITLKDEKQQKQTKNFFDMNYLDFFVSKYLQGHLVALR